MDHNYQPSVPALAGEDTSTGLRNRGVNNNVVDEVGFSDIGGGGGDSEAILRLTGKNSRLEEEARIREEEFQKEREELLEEINYLKSA